MKNTVLVVDDDRAVLEALGQTLGLADYHVISASSYIEAKDHILSDFPGVILSDIRMPGKDGFALLELTKSVDPDLPVILLTGEGDIPMAVRGIQSGAFNFLEKPCETGDLLSVISAAQHAREMVLENRDLKRRLEQGDAAVRMIFGISPQSDDLRQQARRAASNTSEVLISGAPGSGTPKVAEVIHLLSDRASQSFIKCAAAGMTPASLQNALSTANHGTVFIDEIASMDPNTQFELVNKLEDGLSTRVIAGTNQQLESLVDSGAFHAELFYRLNVVCVRIPPLKERPEDIPILFKQYVRQAAEQSGVEIPEISAEMISDLMSQDWPGNARALMNAAMRFVLGLSEGNSSEELGLSEQLSRIEKTLLTDALRRFNGNATEAAKALKLPRKTFYDKLTRHQIRADLYR